MSGDPYKYFRIEAQELLEALTRGVLGLEKGRVGAESLAALLRSAHTLKGAARVVKQAKIADVSHSMEEVFAGLRDRPASLSPERVRQLLGWIDGISAELAALGPPAEPSAASSPAPAAPAHRPPPAEGGEERFEALRVDVADMDALLRTVSELRVQMTGLSSEAQGLQAAARAAGELPDAEPLEDSLRGLHRAVTTILDRAGRQMGDLYEQAHALRLVPADSLFALLERAARDAADATGKTIAFEARGGDVRLDAQGLRLLRHALVHLVRNAVVHGIEPAARRAAAGKPPAGRVWVEAARRGDQGVFQCGDDGQGIDVDRVRQAALARKLLSPSEAGDLTPADAAALLLRGGISTTVSVSQLAGRGIGLDVVRQTVASLHGTVTARTEPGRGTCFELSVPIRIESQEVLHVQAGRSVVSLPRQGVGQALRVRSDGLVSSSQGQSLLVGGQAVRFAPLGRLLKTWQGQEAPATALSALVLQSPDGTAAVGVDRVTGAQWVVIRPLPEALGPQPMVRGAFLDSQGVPQLVLSVEGLVQAVLDAAPAVAEAAAPGRPPLLVIDDSLTTRMLEQGILETAGYEVDTASSGEEALEKARRRRYGVFIVDVEMPGMDGFTFIEAARAAPDLADVPSIVVTSRDAAEDRARGARAGATAYIVKSAFDEAMLLKTIRELVG